MTAPAYTWTTPTSITITLNSLADDTLVTSNAITRNSLDMEHQIKVEIANIAETGDEVVGVFVAPSIDTSEYDTSEDDKNLHFLGNVVMTGSTGTVRRTFEVSPALGGWLPESYKIVCRNSCGIALASSGNSAEYSASRVTIT